MTAKQVTNSIKKYLKLQCTINSLTFFSQEYIKCAAQRQNCRARNKMKGRRFSVRFAGMIHYCLPTKLKSYGFNNNVNVNMHSRPLITCVDGVCLLCKISCIIRGQHLMKLLKNTHLLTD